MCPLTNTHAIFFIPIATQKNAWPFLAVKCKAPKMPYAGESEGNDVQIIR